MKKKIIKMAITSLIIVLSFVLQSYISKELPQMVVTPNLLLIVASFYGFMRGCNTGSIVGLLCGLLVDIFFGDVIGLYALIYMYIGFISGLLKKMFYSDHVFAPMLLVFLTDFIYNLACFVFRFLLRNKVAFSQYFEEIIFPEMIFTTFLALILYRLFYLLNEQVYIEEQERSLSFDK